MDVSPLRHAMAAHVTSGAVPGVVTALVRGDEVEVDAIGAHTHVGAGPAVPMARDTVFRIASLTKPTARSRCGTARPPRARRVLRRLGTLPLLRQPGESWIYDVGSDVLAVLLARAAGTDVATVRQERVFGPFGMVDPTAVGAGRPSSRRARVGWSPPSTT